MGVFTLTKIPVSSSVYPIFRPWCKKTSRVPSYLKYMHVVIKYFWAGIASETAAETAKQFDKNYICISFMPQI